MFRRYKLIDWRRVNRLVFVCAGNICRSPLAEKYARAAGVAAESFGLACGNGFPADPRTCSYALKLHLDLARHSTRNVAQYVPSPADLVVVMEPEQLQQLPAGLASVAQVTLAGLWLARPLPYIHDPFVSTPAYFEICAARVVAATDTLIRRMSHRAP